MKIAATVILYNPNKKDLQNILTYLPMVDKLYVYDNSDENKVALVFEEHNDSKKINYFSDYKNEGVAIRLNQACNQAISDGYDYLLTMDQDSSFLEENLKFYFKDISNYPNKERIGIFGLGYTSENQNAENENRNTEESHDLITSGSVINLNNFKKIGGFDENLFIDGVDFDYCLASIKKGFKCILFKNNYFIHSVGNKTKRGSFKSLYLIKKDKQLHSPLRIYYMMRNMLYLEKKYKLIFPDYVDEIKKCYTTVINTNFNYSKNLISFFKYKYKGINDFKNNRMGKINN
jgi:rhamnosyltransferase